MLTDFFNFLKLFNWIERIGGNQSGAVMYPFTVYQPPIKTIKMKKKMSEFT